MRSVRRSWICGRGARTSDLPAGYADRIGAEGWRPHLTLCYPETQPAPGIWEPLRAWAAHVDVGEATSTAFEAELVAYGDGTERRLGSIPRSSAERLAQTADLDHQVAARGCRHASYASSPMSTAVANAHPFTRLALTSSRSVS